MLYRCGTPSSGGGGSANIKMGTITTSSSSSGDTVTIDCGFKPKKIFVYNNISENKIITDVYDEDLNSTYQVLGYRQNSSASVCNRYSINGTSNGTIVGVSNTGFTWRGWKTFSEVHYVAIG